MKIRQILESVSVGGMGTGSIATVSAPLGKVQKRNKDMEEGHDAHGFHSSIEQGKFLPSKFGNKRYVYLHDLENQSPSTGGPQLVTVDDAGVAKQLANKFGGKVVKTNLDTFRIVQPNRQGVAEVSLGNYLNKASMSRGQAQMGAMFGTDPEQRAKDLATFQKRDKGIERARPRAEKARKDAAEKARSDQLAADKANLPQLIAQYQKLRNQYDPNFEYSDDHSFWSKQKDIQQSMHSLQKRINAAGGSLEENKKGVRAVKHTVKPRNFVAKNAAATTSGAGAHKDKKKAMKQGEVKHKGKEMAYESKLWAALERKVNR